MNGERARPNILLILTDQQRGDCLGIEGHPVLQTPHLDFIGGDGRALPARLLGIADLHPGAAHAHVRPGAGRRTAWWA